MSDERIDLWEAFERGMRLLPALVEMLEAIAEDYREMRELRELDDAEWEVHCEQYGGEEIGGSALFDLIFALDWE